jgi:hypothetical protein
MGKRETNTRRGETGQCVEDKEGSEQNHRSLPFASLFGSMRNNVDRLVESESSQPAGSVIKNKKMEPEILSV